VEAADGTGRGQTLSRELIGQTRLTEGVQARKNLKESYISHSCSNVCIGNAKGHFSPVIYEEASPQSRRVSLREGMGLRVGPLSR